MALDLVAMQTLLKPATAAVANQVLAYWSVMTDDERNQYRADSAKWTHNWEIACAHHRRNPGKPVEWWAEFNAKHEAKRERLHAELQSRANSKPHANPTY